MVSSFCETYYTQSGAPIVAVSCSKGGTNTDFWLPGTPALSDAISRFHAAESYLEENGYIIDHKLMVWYQGCSDYQSSAEVYTDNTLAIFNAMKAEGIESIGVIQISNGPADRQSGHEMIQNAQTALCEQSQSDGIVMISVLPKQLERQADELHLTQSSYETLGADAAENLVQYLTTGSES